MVHVVLDYVRVMQLFIMKCCQPRPYHFIIFFMSDLCLTSLQLYNSHVMMAASVTGRANHITWENQNSWGNQITNLIKITSLTSLH